MKTRILARRLTLALAAFLAMSPLAAPAALADGRGSERNSNRVTITVHVDFPDSENEFPNSRWSSTGAFVDQGWLMPVRQEFGSVRPPRWSVDEDILFTGQNGSFTIRQRARGIDLGATSVGTSRWVVRSGTGAYARLCGSGTGTLEFNWAADPQTLDVTLRGKVRLPEAHSDDD